MAVIENSQLCRVFVLRHCCSVSQVQCRLTYVDCGAVEGEGAGPHVTVEAGHALHHVHPLLHPAATAPGICNVKAGHRLLTAATIDPKFSCQNLQLKVKVCHFISSVTAFSETKTEQKTRASSVEFWRI